MSIRYIFGGNMAGKTEFILDDMAARMAGTGIAEGWPLIYIVPEQFSLQAEKSLISRIPQRAAIRMQVLSFRRLAYFVFSETGRASGSYLEDVGKTMLLRKLLYELRDELMYFGRTADKPGFIERLSETVSEFYRYGVTTEVLDGWAAAFGEGDRLRLKIQDLSLIFKRFSELTEERYIPTDAMLDVLAERIDRSERLRGAEIWISGFHGFTPQEYKVLEKLVSLASGVTVALALRTKATSYAYLRDTDPYLELKRTVNKITAIASERCIKLAEPVLLPDTGEKPALAFLEKSFLARGVFEFGKVPEEIELISADNRYAEIHFAAAKITELVRGKGYEYGDIAVMLGDVGSFSRDISVIFGQYDIPVFIDRKTDVKAQPLVELIRSAVDIVAYNWTYEAVFRFLKTGLSGMQQEMVDELENYALAYGIKGYKWHVERWKYGFDEQNPDFDEQSIHAARDQLKESISAFSGLRADKKITVAELSKRIFEMLEQLKVTDTLSRWIDELESIGEREQARQFSQIWGKVCNMFDTLVEILGDESMSVREHAKIIEAGFDAVDMGIIPPSQSMVVVGDLERSRLPNIRALFIVGVNEGILPVTKDDPGLIGDEDRTRIASGSKLAPTSKARSFEQQFLIYQALISPSEMLYLSYSTGKLDGKAMFPSTLLIKLKKLFPLLTEKKAERILTSARPMFAELAANLRKIYAGAADDEFLRLYSWFASDAVYGEKLRVMDRVIHERTGGERLSQSSADRLYGSEVNMSVSRLERYVQCPYAYYLQYNLGALERKIYEVQAVELGNLYHDALQMITETLEQAGRSWRKLTIPEISDLVDSCVTELAPRLGSEVLLSTARYQYVVKRAGKILKKSVWALAEHLKRGSFEIFGTELDFGIDGPVTAVKIELTNGRTLVLQGRIDRIDIFDSEGGKQYVKIIDYKSGSNEMDIDDIYFGTQLQLMLYIDAFIKSGVMPNAAAGGVFYFNLNDPVVTVDGRRTQEEIEVEILKAFRMSGVVVADKDVVRGIDADIGRSSQIVEARIKADGSIDGKAATPEAEFDKLRSSVNEKIREIGERITDGYINIFPYKKADRTGCAFCKYGAVCRFERSGKYNTVR